MFIPHSLRRLTFALGMVLAGQVSAGSPLDTALKNGERLDADAIAAQIAGHTVTARAGDKTFIFYYAPDNVLSGRMVGGSWSDTGYYGITDGGQICLSMTPDKGRLRCMTLVAQDGIVRKFNAAGDQTFELLSFEPGNKL